MSLEVRCIGKLYTHTRHSARTLSTPATQPTSPTSSAALNSLQRVLNILDTLQVKVSDKHKLVPHRAHALEEMPATSCRSIEGDIHIYNTS